MNITRPVMSCYYQLRAGFRFNIANETMRLEGASRGALNDFKCYCEMDPVLSYLIITIMNDLNEFKN